MGLEWVIGHCLSRYFACLRFSSHAERKAQMTQKKQKTVRKNDKKSIVNIPESGYNEEQEETIGGKLYKDFKELDLTNNFLFLKVMQDPELCRKLLEIILDVDIEHIEYSEKEKTLDEKLEAKSVRLDVYLKDGRGTVYDVEMQTTNPGNLPKRSRYYQDMIDLNLLAKGDDYEKLNKSFVIFICMEDIFKGGRHIYTFENRCIQNPDIALGDETTKIFLNPHSEMDDVSPELANFLKFLIDGKPVDEFTERLVVAVETAKNNKKLELEYMSYYANLHDKYNEGLEAGLKAGHQEGHEKGFNEGLRVMVKTLKSILKDFDKVYDAVVENKEYADITREEVMEYYQKCS